LRVAALKKWRKKMAVNAVKNPALFEPAETIHRMHLAASSAGLGMSSHF
jgi:hypothetical protein